jgi:hypothetical protein
MGEGAYQNLKEDGIPPITTDIPNFEETRKVFSQGKN